jgi:acetolactate synthase-1/2/3 large subunit
VKATVEKTLSDKKTVVIDFVVEKEDTVFPMVPAGADLDKMIRRPKQDVMLESGSDKEWEMPSSTLPNVFAEAKAEAAALNGTHGKKAARPAAKPTRKAPKAAKSRR